jgi:hypothetical protein
MARKKRKSVKKAITAKQKSARRKNMAVARASKKKGGKRKEPKQSKQKVPGMRGKKKVPTGMRTNRKTGTRLYGPNIYTP